MKKLGIKTYKHFCYPCNKIVKFTIPLGTGYDTCENGHQYTFTFNLKDKKIESIYTPSIPLSNCCKAPVRTNLLEKGQEISGITFFYYCSKCGKSCDTYQENNKMLVVNKLTKTQYVFGSRCE